MRSDYHCASYSKTSPLSSTGKTLQHTHLRIQPSPYIRIVCYSSHPERPYRRPFASQYEGICLIYQVSLSVCLLNLVVLPSAKLLSRTMAAPSITYHQTFFNHLSIPQLPPRYLHTCCSHSLCQISSLCSHCFKLFLYLSLILGCINVQHT